MKLPSYWNIPATMATQHPDNAFAPYWSSKPFISTAIEVEECYRSFSDLGCQEYMWDWEGKFVDEAVVDRLYQKYYDYFKKHPLGEVKFLTFRIPNIQKEGKSRLSRAFAGILSASYSAQELGLHVPPLFEVIHPMTSSADQLIILQKKFYETAQFQQKILEMKNLKPEYLRVIPLIEGTGTLLKSRKILEKYSHFYERFTGKRPRLLRPFIARSDPALDSGFIAAVLSAKAALSEYFLFEKATGIKVFPIIGAGSLRFRGGLSPQTLEEFMKTYPGIATVTVQSSFRYDHPLEEVQKAITKLNRQLPNADRVIFSPRQMEMLDQLDRIFVKYYRSTVEGLVEFINHLAQYIPSRRERLLHVGHFGYSRDLGRKKLNLPRAITFTAVFYSVGIPPEFIGLGQSLQEARDQKLLAPLERFYPEMKEALLNAGRYLNRENLEILAGKSLQWKKVRKGVLFIEEYLGKKLGPETPEDFIHRNYTSNVIQHWLKKTSPEEDIQKAAQVRRSLG